MLSSRSFLMNFFKAETLLLIGTLTSKTEPSPSTRQESSRDASLAGGCSPSTALDKVWAVTGAEPSGLLDEVWAVSGVEPSGPLDDVWAVTDAEPSSALDDVCAVTVAGGESSRRLPFLFRMPGISLSARVDFEFERMKLDKRFRWHRLSEFESPRF